MSSATTAEFLAGTSDELELYLRWLAYLRGAVLRKVEDPATRAREGPPMAR